MSDVRTLSGLEPAAFEHLVNALALKVLGAGSTGFGPGPDAGRDGWFEGEAPYPSASQRWKGVWYIQSKFHAPHLSKDAQKWLLHQIKAELRAFSDPASKRVWPDNWIVATNIDLSAAAASGTFDQARRLVQKARPSLTRRFHIWGGRKLCDFLSDYPEVGKRFGHFLTPGHVLAALFTALHDERATVEDVVHYLVVRGIEDQKHTRLEQAGSTEDRRPGIDALFVDLPFVDARCHFQAQLAAALGSASATSHRLDPTDSSGEGWSAWRKHPTRASVWFVRAGPGRGKSSISQFFCQVQRAALILQPDGISVHPDIRSLANRIRDRAKEVACWPHVPRIPLWVELKSYAAWYAEQKPSAAKGVASFLCSMLAKDIEVSVSVKTLRRALTERSWVVVFDGLDEVPGDVKDDVAAEVVRFVRDTVTTSDLLALCTSRPQGYAGQFDVLDGAVVDLVDLPPKLALECAAKVAAIDRSPQDVTRARALLERAIEAPGVRELMTTPLQAHIMAVLVRNGQRPPERKWDLYHRFYEVIREREANRELPDPRLRELFQGDTTLIDTVHQRLGFVLHTRAEKAAGADASLAKLDFRRLVEQVVLELRSSADVTAVVDAVMQATTERLVLINTPDQGDRVRFDIRAIQEFFAAESLYVDVSTDDLRSRLGVLVGDSHWREVVQFLLGALVSGRRATELLVALDVLGWFDDGAGDSNQRALHLRLAAGAFHAALLLENGAAEGSRRLRDQLRERLVPIAGATDAALLWPFRRISGPESRAWLWEWGLEQLRERAPREAVGAMQVLAALCDNDRERQAKFLTAMESIPTAYLGVLASEWWQEERFGEARGTASRDWVAALLDLVLSRPDAVAAAPALISQVLWEAATHASAGERGSTRRRVAGLPDQGRGPVRTTLVRMFDRLKLERVGGVEIGVPRLSSFGKRELERLASEPGEDRRGIFAWLALVWRASHEPTVRHVRAVLQSMGESWMEADSLPLELRRGIPTPQNRFLVSPSAMEHGLAALTDEELERGLTDDRVGLIPLSRLRLTARSFFRFGPPGDEAPAILAVAERFPEIAWMLWCYTRDRARGGRGGTRESDLRSSIAALLIRDPYLTLEVPASVVLAGLTALGPELPHVRSALRSAGLAWRLRFADFRAMRSPSLAVVLPVERPFLVPVASSALAWVVAVLEHGREEGGSVDSIRNSVAEAVGDVRALAEAADDECEAPDVRVSAALLAGIHPHGGIGEVMVRREMLGESLALGIPATAGVAAVIEVLGMWQDRPVRRVLSELVALSRSTDRLPTDPFSETRALDVVLRRWRERSSAPVTSSALLVPWLDGASS